MKEFEPLLTTRRDKIDNVGPWKWIKADNGAWDGPKDDWLTSHKHEYFRNVKQKRVVIQAGGNLGMYPRLLADIFEIVYTFEPDPLNFHCLVENCQKENIIKIQGALGRHPGFVTVNRNHVDNVGMNTVTPNRGAVPMFALDQFNFAVVDCILLDVEGFERPVLDGAAHTIAKFRPVLAIENGHHSEIEQFVAQFGYVHQSTSKADKIYYVPDSIRGAS